MILKYRYKELINFICKLFLPLFSDYAKMKPSLFSRYLPTVLPSTSVHDLEQYIAETRQMQEDMKMIPEFRGYDIPDTIKSTVYQNGNHLTFVLIEEKCKLGSFKYPLRILYYLYVSVLFSTSWVHVLLLAQSISSMFLLY